MSDRFFPDCNKDINVTAGDLSPDFCKKAWRLVECIEALASKFLREKTCEPASVQYALNMELRNVDDILKIHLQHESQCHDVTAYINSTPKLKAVELTTGGTNATIPANETNATTHPAASKVSSTSTGGPLPTVTTLPASENSSASFIGSTDTQENVTESSSQTLEDSTNGCNGISTAIEFLITLGAAAIVVLLFKQNSSLQDKMFLLVM
ncbi:hypothetical protein DdX_17526 [Ditylenchus destructor]|uniref:Uncharacterized protein n=1 Tax=Ditylenchus destructor TaxID=166010 RepID=A0AAD4MLZ4_9BILA|nr:hypothetical protein DdX_17526 [Ditylenchus destructor]